MKLAAKCAGSYHLTVFRSLDRVADDMIEVVPSAWDGHGAWLRLRPPRALSRRQFVVLFAALSGAMWIVAMLGWWGGNAFAPAFAFPHSAIVATALRAFIRVAPDVVRKLDQMHADRSDFRAIGRVIAPWGRRIGDQRFESEGAWKRTGTTVDTLSRELKLALEYPEGAA